MPPSVASSSTITILLIMDDGLKLQHPPTVQCPHNHLIDGLHPQHTTEAFVFNACKQFCEQIGSHVISADELEINRLVLNALLNEMIAHINMLHHHMVYWVPCK